jgi:hypothetical protein
MMKTLSQLTAIALCCAIATSSFASSYDWTAWDQLLSRHVDDGYVDYTAMKDAPEVGERVAALAQADPETMSRKQQLAFYINSYNLLAIAGIVAGRSPASLLGRARFFRFSTYQLGDERLSLQALEHERILPLAEPRIHFAIVCASLSCPKLRSEAYSAEQLERQLDDNAMDFLNDASKNRFDKNQRIAWVSKIFDWYSEDFEEHGGSLQAYMADYATDPEVAALLRQQAFTIRYLDYDWSLNGSL